jgi:hypothetical protein
MNHRNIHYKADPNDFTQSRYNATSERSTIILSSTATAKLIAIAKVRNKNLATCIELILGEELARFTESRRR